MDKRRIDEYIKDAILENNVAKREAYRAIKADILLLETSKSFKGEVKEADIIKIIRKIIVQKEESITMYESNKPDLGNRMETINTVINQFLPLIFGRHPPIATEVNVCCILCKRKVRRNRSRRTSFIFVLCKCPHPRNLFSGISFGLTPREVQSVILRILSPDISRSPFYGQTEIHRS